MMFYSIKKQLLNRNMQVQELLFHDESGIAA